MNQTDCMTRDESYLEPNCEKWLRRDFRMRLAVVLTCVVLGVIGVLTNVA